MWKHCMFFSLTTWMSRVLLLSVSQYNVSQLVLRINASPKNTWFFCSDLTSTVFYTASVFCFVFSFPMCFVCIWRNFRFIGVFKSQRSSEVAAFDLSGTPYKREAHRVNWNLKTGASKTQPPLQNIQCASNSRNKVSVSLVLITTSSL